VEEVESQDFPDYEEVIDQEEFSVVSDKDG